MSDSVAAMAYGRRVALAMLKGGRVERHLDEANLIAMAAVAFEAGAAHARKPPPKWTPRALSAALQRIKEGAARVG